MKQQESCPFTTAGNHLKIIVFCMVIICVHHEGMVCKNLSIFLYFYADFVIE